MRILRKQLEVGSDPAEVRRARDWVRAQLADGQGSGGAGRGAVSADTLVLLVSELVTNAVVHTGRPAMLTLLLPAEDDAPRLVGADGEGGRSAPGAALPEQAAAEQAAVQRGAAEPPAVRLEVVDDSSRAPRRRSPGRDETSGRGLELVELLADRWGWQREGDGKRIWCELDLPVCEHGHESRKVPARY